MKGSLKKIHDHLKNTTNFNDWCDPKDGYVYRKQKQPLSEAKHSQFQVPQLQKDRTFSQTSNEIETIRRNVRRGYPLLSLREVRDFKLPFCESLLLNLQDDGYTGTYQFIKDILDLDERLHETAQDRSIKKRPHLKLNEYALRLLSDRLIAAEKANKEGNKSEETSCLLDLAMDFAKLDNGLWYWLSEELYEQCIHISNTVESPTEYDKELEAIAKHLFAEFLLNITHEPTRAKNLLLESMKLSEGKFYNASVVTGEFRELLYLDSCLLLHKALTAIANEIREINIVNAMQLYKHSLHWAKVVNNKKAETTALLNLIDIYIAANQLELVADLLKNYMKLCTEQTNILGLCEGYILSAKYHNLTEQHNLEAENLRALLQTAEENNLGDKLALAHYKLAMFYLLHDDKGKAQFHACEAYNCYVTLKKRPEIEAASCLAGIYQGQQVLPQYINLISKTEKAYSTDFKILMQWKTLHIPFFSNVKLLQPESVQNSYLQSKLEHLINQDFESQSSDDFDGPTVSVQSSRRTLLSYASRFNDSFNSY